MYKNQLTVYLILTIFFITIYYAMFSIVNYQKGMVMAIGLPMAIVAWNFVVNWGDFWPWKRGVQVNTFSGLVGTQVGSPIDEHSGEETRYVAFERRAIKAIMGHRVNDFEGIWSGLRDVMTGTATIPITAKKSLWEDVPGEDCENRNGCVWFRGKISGGSLRNPKIVEGQAHIERLSQMLSYSRTAFTQLEDQLMTLANMKMADTEYMSERLKFIADNVKRNNIIVGGRSGGLEGAAGDIA